MKKILMIVFLMFGVLLITGCDFSVDSIKDKYNEVRNDDDGCDGWKENGKCCTAVYEGKQVDSNGECGGAQKPGAQIGHGTEKKNCYTLSCK